MKIRRFRWQCWFAVVCLGLSIAYATGKKETAKKDISIVDNLREKLFQLEDHVMRALASPRWKVAGKTELFTFIIGTYKTFGNEIEDRFPTDRERYLNSLNSLWIWARTQTTLESIDGLYNVFRQMQHDIIDRNGPVNVKRLEDFASTILHDPNASVPRALAQLSHNIVAEKLFISAYQEASQEICNEQQSAQQILYNLYTTTALTEIKGYTMMQFSYMLLRLYDKGSNFTEEMKLLKQQYAERTSETIRAVKTAMAFAPRDVWKCDPVQHKIDETYTELKQLFQGYIVNEVDLNSDFSCRENCAYYGYAKVYGCYQNQFCSQQRRCNGKLLNCEYVDSDMWICPSNLYSDRRYEYIEYENGRLFGQKKKGTTCQRPTTKVDSWWRWLFWHCSYCFCYCDDHNASSHRYFSLREVIADIKNNRVVTGIRFVKDKQIVHLQIREGQLLPRGNINSSTVQWKAIETFSVLDSDVRNGRDYHTIVWEKRGVDLDDLLPSEDHLLTGVRFRVLGSRLNLEIMVTPFNFSSGKLIKPMEKSYWHSNDITERTSLKLDRPDVPTRSLLPSVPDSTKNMYVEFGPSDRESDAAQSTVPFVDVQPIEPRPPMPISGAGIFHKGRKGSGGFIALKLITYNLAPHLEADLPAAPPIIKTLSDVRAV